jgi:uncharacterized membrane protein
MVATVYDWLLFGHIVAAMVWLGGGVMLAAFAVGAVRGGDPAAVARLVRSLRVVGPAILAPATIAAPALGVWLVLDSDAWDFGQTWVQLALALFAAAFAVGAAHQSRAAIGAPTPDALDVGLWAGGAPAAGRRLGHGLQARAVIDT